MMSAKRKRLVEIEEPTVVSPKHTPIRDTAKTICNQLNMEIEAANTKVRLALSGAHPSNINKSAYTFFEEIWVVIKYYFPSNQSENLYEVAGLEAIARKFETFQLRLPQYPSYAGLNSEQIQFFKELVNMYAKLAMQRYILLQLHTFGLELAQLEADCRNTELDNLEKLTSYNIQEEQKLKTDLTDKCNYISANLDELLTANQQIAQYKKSLQANLTSHQSTVATNCVQHKEKYTELSNDYGLLNEKIKDHITQVKTAKATIQTEVSEVNSLDFQSIKEQLQFINTRLMSITKKNVLAFEDDLQAHGFEARLKKLYTMLQTFKQNLNAKESAFNQEADALKQQAAKFNREVVQLKNLRTGGIADIIENKTFLKTFFPLTPAPQSVMQQQNKTVTEIELLQGRLTRSVASYYSREQANKISKEKLEQLLANIQSSRAVHYMVSVRESNRGMPLVDVLGLREKILPVLQKRIKAQYDLFISLFNDSENQKRWEEVDQAFAATVTGTKKQLEELQLAINERSLNDEVIAIKATLKEQEETIARNAAIIKQRCEDGERVLNIYTALKAKVEQAILQAMLDAFNDAKNSMQIMNDNKISALSKLQQSITDFNPSLTEIAPRPIVLMDKELITQLEMQMTLLQKNLVEKKIWLDHAVLQREQKKIKQQNEAVFATGVAMPVKKVNPSAQTLKSQSAPDKKPGFFRKHWKKMLAGAVAGGVLGAALGFGLGWFGLPFSLGVSIPIFTAGFFLAGFTAGLIWSFAKELRDYNQQATLDMELTDNIDPPRPAPGDTASISRHLKERAPKHVVASGAASAAPDVAPPPTLKVVAPEGQDPTFSEGYKLPAPARCGR